MNSIPPLARTTVPETFTLPGASLGDVLKSIPNLTGVSKNARQNMASGVRTFCKVLGRDPNFTLATGHAFRNLVEVAQPGAAGITPSRWRNVLSETRRAIRLTGHLGTGNVNDSELSDDWLGLVSRVKEPWTKSSIRRFGQFCTNIQARPQDMSLELLGRYEAYLDQTSLQRCPDRSIGVLARAWNAYAKFDADWPAGPVTLPDRRDKYAVDWEDMPTSLAEDVAAFRKNRLNPDVFDPDAGQAVSSRTAETQDGYLRRLVAIIIENGTPKNDLLSLADVVEPERVKAALNVFLERKNQQSTSQIQGIANLTLIIARRWSHLPPEQVKELERISKKLRKPQVGLTAKNRQRLQQFDDQVVDAVLDLPQQLVHQVKSQGVNNKTVLRVQAALAIELFIFAPLRVSNMCALDRQKSFVYAGSGGKRILHLIVPAIDVWTSPGKVEGLLIA